MEESPVISALLIGPEGRGKEFDPTAAPPGEGIPWVHLDYTHPGAGAYLHEHWGLDEHVVKALTAPATRPTSFCEGDGLVIILRGINFNPGADPLDMVSVRCWVTPGLIITARRQKLMAIDELRRELAEGRGPVSAGDFLTSLLDRLISRMAVVFDGMEDSEEEIEEQILRHSAFNLRPLISDLRRRVIGLRRYLAPQRQVIYQLQAEPLSWLSPGQRNQLREIADRVTRQVEELDATRDRAAVAQDELESKLAERLTRNMYLLSVVAAIFLPLGLVTGLLGINVRGIPGADHPAGFAVVCVLLLVIALLEVWLFKRLRLL